MSKIFSFFFLPSHTPQFPPVFSRLVERKEKNNIPFISSATKKKSKTGPAPIIQPKKKKKKTRRNPSSLAVCTRSKEFDFWHIPSMGCTHSNSSYFSLSLSASAYSSSTQTLHPSFLDSAWVYTGACVFRLFPFFFFWFWLSHNVRNHADIQMLINSVNRPIWLLCVKILPGNIFKFVAWFSYFWL